MTIKGISISFYLIRTRKQNVYCKLTKKNHIVSFSTGLEIDPRHWDRGHPNLKSSKGKMIKNILDKLQFNLIDIIGNMTNPTPHKVKARYLGYAPDGQQFRKVGLIETVDIYMTNNKINKDTQRSFKSIKKHLEKFIPDRFGIDDIQLVDLNFDHIHAIVKHFEDSGIKYNTRRAYKQKLGKMVQFVLDNYNPDNYNLPSRNLFEQYKVQKSSDDMKFQLERSKQKKWVDDNTLNKLEHAWDLDEALRYNLNIWLLQRWTGMAWNEIIHFDPEIHIGTDISGNKSIRILRRKTLNSSGKYSVIPIFPETEELINFFNESRNSNWNRSFIKKQSYHNYSQKLIDISEKLKIKTITTHMARHTFAVKMLEMGFSMEAVSDMLGHASIRMTQGFYAEITPSKIQHEYDLIITKKINKQKQISSNT